MTKKFTTKKLKIAQVPGDQIPFSPALFGSPHSITAVSYLLTEELVKKGHKVTAFVPSDSKTSAKIAPNWIPSTDVRFKKYKFGSKERYNLFKNYCQNVINQADNFDIIHIHDLFLGAFKFLKDLKTPALGTFHNPKFYKKDKKYSKVIFVGISKKQIQNNPGFNFVGMVYNGIPLEKYSFNEKPKNYLLWIGRVSPEKGPLEAIKVAKKTKKKLIMLGPLPSHHKSYIKKVLSEVKKNKKNISFLGLVSFKKKINLLKNALVLLSPIKWEEPFGLVMVEAMACGTPVIAFNRGSAPEIIRNNKTGFLVKNVNEMAKAIEKIPMISRKKCREHAEKNFTVQKMAKGYEKVYRKIVKNKKIK